MGCWNVEGRSLSGKKSDEVVAHQQEHSVFLYVVGILGGTWFPFT